MSAATEIVRSMLEASVAEIGRDAYLASPTGRARVCLSELERLTRRADALAHEVGTALTRGDNYPLAVTLCEELLDAQREARAYGKELEIWVRLIAGEQAK